MPHDKLHDDAGTVTTDVDHSIPLPVLCYVCLAASVCNEVSQDHSGPRWQAGSLLIKCSSQLSVQVVIHLQSSTAQSSQHITSVLNTPQDVVSHVVCVCNLRNPRIQLIMPANTGKVNKASLVCQEFKCVRDCIDVPMLILRVFSQLGVCKVWCCHL